LLSPHSPTQRGSSPAVKVVSQGNAWTLSARTSFYCWTFPSGSMFAASLVWSPREFASREFARKKFASCHSMTAGLKHGNRPHHASFTGIKVIAS